MTEPIALFDPHSSSNGLTFGEGFAGYNKRDLFVAQFGQTEFINGCVTSFGHRIVKVRIRKQANKWKADPPEDFVTGLDLPLDVTIGPDGGMYIAEYRLGRIWRLFQTAGGPSSVPETPSPAILPFFRFAPNPATREAAAEWASDPRTRIQFRVFDITGRRIRDLDGGESGRVSWNLRDAAGRRVSAGLYLIEARSGDARGVTRLLVLE